MQEDWEVIPEAERKAPTGKFRVIAVDMQTTDGLVYLVDDLDDVAKAIQKANGLLKTKFDGFFGYQVHDEQGNRLLGESQ